MAVTLGDAWATEIRDYLAANLPTTIAAVNTAESLVAPDAIVAPSAFFAHDPDSPGQVSAPPNVYVAAGRASIPQWGESYSWENIDGGIWIIDRIGQGEAEKLKRRLYLYARALWITLRAGHFDGSLLWQMVDGVEPVFDYSPILVQAQAAAGEVQFTARWSRMEED